MTSILEPSHNVTVYRCPACLELLAEVPPGFVAKPEDLAALAEAHHLLKHTKLEIHLADGTE